MVRCKFLVLFVVISCGLSAQLHEPVFPGESGSALIGKVRLEFRPSSVLSYSEARTEMYTKIYNVQDSVECVYSGYKLPLSPSDPDPIARLSMNGSSLGINCEHTFPQSKGAGNGNPRSDMHHLFPTRSRVNEARLNYEFDEVDDRTTNVWFIDSKEQTQIPSENIDDYSELGFRAFEPREVHKGNVARAIFYFYAIYREVADADFFGDMRTTLCEWHYEDAVDSLEWNRNLQIASYQSDKRNPFILDCTLAARTFCPDVPNRCMISSTREQLTAISDVFPNPVNDRLNVSLETYPSERTLSVISSLGVEVLKLAIPSGKTETEVLVEQLNSGIYHLLIRDTRSGTALGRASFTIQ